MGTLEENLNHWSNYDWARHSEEWSAAWGGTEFLWWGTIFPRIHAFVPTQSILEIGPGFGRCTEYLKEICRHLAVVDLTERCIAACRQRFASSSHLTYWVNNGKSLDMIADDSIDFVFSYDSLIHAESDVIAAYLAQLPRKLKRNGVGFIHHSNVGVYLDPQTGRLPFENVHWRAESMTAKRFQEYCEEAGLQCIGQELISYRGTNVTDCFSLFSQKSSSFARPNKILEHDVYDELTAWLTLSQLYKFDPIRERI